MSKERPKSSAYVKYSGLAFQMFFLLLAGWFIGSYGDGYFNFEKPYIALALAFVFLIVFFYKLYNDLEKDRL